MFQYGSNELPSEIVLIIFNFLSIQDLIKIELICHKFNKIVKNNNWENITIKSKDIENIKHIITNYNFVNYDFSESNITDENVKMLGNCHTLNLSGCKKITDESIKMLGNCHTLYLSYCDQI